MTLDSLLFNAGTLFFAAWIAVIAGVSVAAFGRGLFPTRTDPSPMIAQNLQNSTSIHLHDSRRHITGAFVAEKRYPLLPTMIGWEVGAAEPASGSTVIAKVFACIPACNGGLTTAALP